MFDWLRQWWGSGFAAENRISDDDFEGFVDCAVHYLLGEDRKNIKASLFLRGDTITVYLDDHDFGFFRKFSISRNEIVGHPEKICNLIEKRFRDAPHEPIDRGVTNAN